jgi:hypothetical protein
MVPSTAEKLVPMSEKIYNNGADFHTSPTCEHETKGWTSVNRARPSSYTPDTLLRLQGNRPLSARISREKQAKKLRAYHVKRSLM